MYLSLYKNNDTIKIYTDIKEYDVVDNTCLVYNKQNRNKGILGVYDSPDIIKYIKYLVSNNDIKSLASVFKYIEKEEVH